ncbi:hypothetical protein [Candidatus Hodarchaeum mangrovi]
MTNILKRSSVKKVVLSLSPFILLLFSIHVLNIINSIYINPLDQMWDTRQFILGIFMFSGLLIFPRLAQLEIAWINNKPKVYINFTHHPLEIRAFHELKVKNMSFCVGCLGSFIGLLLSEFIFLFYFISINSFLFQNTREFFIIGLLLIVISYSRYLVKLPNLIRLIQHASLFLGIAFLVITIDVYFTSTMFMLLMLPSWILFLITRVYLGKNAHKEAFHLH